MEYSTVSMLERLGALVDNPANTRDDPHEDMKRGDAQQAALSGIRFSRAADGGAGCA